MTKNIYNIAHILHQKPLQPQSQFSAAMATGIALITHIEMWQQKYAHFLF